MTRISPTDVSALLNGVAQGRLVFDDIISYIHDHYHYIPIAFENGDIHNAKGQNEGSAKILSFAKMHGLNQLDTLSLFAEHYLAVLDTPEGTDHANIRNFRFYGWQGVHLPSLALSPRG